MAMLFGLSSISDAAVAAGRPLPTSTCTLPRMRVLAALTCARSRAGRWRGVTLGDGAGAIAISSFYGVTDEYPSAASCPAATSSVLDMLADAIGSVAGCGRRVGVEYNQASFETRDVL